MERALGVGVPAADAGLAGTAREVFAGLEDRDWIVNSRHTADADVLRTVGSLAGIEPRVSHRADSLELVQDLIAAGLGVALLPADQPVRPDVSLVPLEDPAVRLRAYAVVRRGRSAWPPLALVLDRLRAGARPVRSGKTPLRAADRTGRMGAQASLPPRRGSSVGTRSGSCCGRGPGGSHRARVCRRGARRGRDPARRCWCARSRTRLRRTDSRCCGAPG